jgi:hypothetical protein
MGISSENSPKMRSFPMSGRSLYRGQGRLQDHIMIL